MIQTQTHTENSAVGALTCLVFKNHEDKIQADISYWFYLKIIALFT